VKAFDRDPFDQLMFAIVRDEDRRLFDIDSVDGTVRAVEGLDVDDYLVNVSVTDGRFVRYANVRIIVEGISADAKDSAVVVRLDHLSPAEFVGHHLHSFVLALRSELAVRETDIKVGSFHETSFLI
jgi:protocadherin Fat 1/2/3